MDGDRILDQLFVGSCPIEPADIDALKNEGVSAVLNLQTDEDFRSWGIDWNLLEAYYADRGLVVRRMPVTDFDRDALREQLPQCVAALADLIRDGHTVYVHCSAGVNRSPSTVIAYLHWVDGWSWQEAVNHVLASRDCDPYLDAILAAAAEADDEASANGGAPGQSA